MKILFFFLVFSNLTLAQSLRKISKLSNDLKEVSGLEVLNDSCFLAINDSRNENIIYVLNLNGKIIHQFKITNAQNIDWEDLSKDTEGNFYVGDIGNNLNNRKNLCIYKFNGDSVLHKNQIIAEKIEFVYEDQIEFPSTDQKNLNFDAEAIGIVGDEILIFTKCRNIPYDGISNVYKLPNTPGKFKAKKHSEIQLKARRMMFDAVTSVTFNVDTCYLLTYTGIEIFCYSKGNFKKIKRKRFLFLSQKESICFKNKQLYLANEYLNIFSKNKLSKIKLK